MHPRGLDRRAAGGQREVSVSRTWRWAHVWTLAGGSPALAAAWYWHRGANQLFWRS